MTPFARMIACQEAHLHMPHRIKRRPTPPGPLLARAISLIRAVQGTLAILVEWERTV